MPGVDAARDVPPAGAFCSGATGLVFAFQVLGGGAVEPGSALLSDNGFSYFFLAGDCRYWVQADTRTAPRTGQTTSEEVERLFHPSRLGGLAGSYRGASFDGSTVRLATRSGVVDCHAGCSGDGVPTALREASTDAYQGAQALWQRGQELDGGLRFLAVSGVGLRPGAPTFRWPLLTPIADVSVPRQEAGRLGAGAGRAVTSPSDLAALLDLRRRHLELSEFQRGTSVAVVEAGVSYALWMRRTIPIEDERGIVPVAALLSGAAR